MLSSVLPVVIAVSLSAAPKLALLPLSAGEGVSEQVSRSITDALGAELRNQGAQLLTQQDLSAVLSVERQKQLMGCSDSSCMAEIAGALDVDGVVVGSLARLGESYLLSAQYVDSRTGTTKGHASRRKKGGKIDDVLDELPAVAKELLGGRAAPGAAAAALQAPEVKARPEALPPPLADLPATLDATQRAALLWLGDGAGHFVAVLPSAIFDGVFFFGNAEALHAQRVFGGGSEGDVAFSVSFWEPRARSRADASFALEDGRYTLHCGDRDIRFTPVKRKQAAALAKTARLYAPRWQRYAYALARDDEGNYFYVDRAREPDESTDFHLFVGPLGKVTGYPAQLLAHDTGGDLFRIAEGKLSISSAQGQAAWVTGERRTPLTVLPIDEHARFVYSQLGAYPGLALGTPCDLAFH